MKKQLLLIDGTSYIYRAFYAIPHLSNSKGLPTNAIYGFAQMLLKVIKDFKTDHIAVAFDVKGPSFRHKLYEEYKAHRPEMPDNLKPQIPYIKEIVKAFNIPCLELEGYEADDIIGTISKHMKERGLEVIIIAADKDMLQLIDDNTTIVDTMKDKKFDKKDVMERFGVEPDRVVEIMGLAGDTSDNIPGVKGIGEKTAIKLIHQFGTIENILQNVEDVKDKRIKERLEAHAEDAILSKRLALIDTNVPIEYKFDDLITSSPDYPRLKELLMELEFTKLLKEIIPNDASNKGRYTSITDINALNTLISKMQNTMEMAISVKVEKAMSDNVTGIAICIKPHEAYYIPIGHSYLGVSQQLDKRSVVKAIQAVIETESIRKISDDIKKVYMFFKLNNIQMKGVVADTGIAAYLLNPARSNKGIADIAYEELDYRILSSKISSYKDIDINTACDIFCSEVDAAYQLSGRFLPQLESAGLLKLFNGIEMPLAEVLAEMELSGIKIDNEYLIHFSKELEDQIFNTKKEIYAIAGAEFNINSPKQLSEILFEKLKLKPVKKTKTGFSTDEEVLRILAVQHELPNAVLNFRELSKLKSTYVDALLELINPLTHRVHTSLNQTVAATGRLSSSEPNLQNIPIKTELGKRIRQAFVADKKCLFLSADYSQIELRIVAHLSGDHLLIDAFKNDKDIHTQTASEVFGLAPELITAEMRRRAKAINFGIIYGMGAYGLSAALGISQDEARSYIDNYFLHYKEVKAFIDKTINEAIENGYVTTLFGRRRYIPEIRSESEQIRRLGERMAINTPIQGTAADMIKIAMINISKRLKSERLYSKMLLQVHDELIFECPTDETEIVKRLVKEEMEGVSELTVPIRVDMKIGNTWADLD